MQEVRLLNESHTLLAESKPIEFKGIGQAYFRIKPIDFTQTIRHAKKVNHFD